MDNELKNLKFVMYMRKSSESDDRQALSLDAQHDTLMDVVKRNKLKVIAEFREAKSASKPNNRPEFDKMVKLISAGKVNAILCWKEDRLFRNPAESGLIQQLLVDGKIQRIMTPCRSHTPDDNTIGLAVEAGMSAQYTRDLSRNVKRGQRANNKLGGVHFPAPQGYINVRRNNHGTLDLDQERAPLMRKAFDMYLTGNYTVPEVLSTLNNDWGFLTRKHYKTGGKPLNRSSLYAILENPVYMGYVRDLEDKTQLHKGDWPALLSEDEFYRIQMLLKKSGFGPQSNYSLNHFELKGIFTCGECGCSITAEIKSKKLKDGSVNYYTYYHCTHKRKCSQKGCIREERLYDQIQSLFGQYRIDQTLYDLALEAMKDISAKEIAERLDIDDSQNVKIETMQAEHDRLIDMATRGLISDEDFERKSKQIKTDIERMKTLNAELQHRLKNRYEIIGSTLNKLKQQDEFIFKSQGTKRSMVHAIGYNPTIIDKNIDITPYTWLEPIKKFLKKAKSPQSQVITNSERGRKCLKNDLSPIWRRVGDSNSRSRSPQTNDLANRPLQPLG